MSEPRSAASPGADPEPRPEREELGWRGAEGVWATWRDVDTVARLGLFHSKRWRTVPPRAGGCGGAGVVTPPCPPALAQAGLAPGARQFLAVWPRSGQWGLQSEGTQTETRVPGAGCRVLADTGSQGTQEELVGAPQSPPPADPQPGQNMIRPVLGNERSLEGGLGPSLRRTETLKCEDARHCLELGLRNTLVFLLHQERVPDTHIRSSPLPWREKSQSRPRSRCLLCSRITVLQEGSTKGPGQVASRGPAVLTHQVGVPAPWGVTSSARAPAGLSPCVPRSQP